ncbi:hypothetical protein [Melioribacter sp. OK-6-Me]|uniref:hypothetical protein n=1 Tax=unclassified Melioribacter TaxID=2627329 RepID=UPI003EDA2532
MINRLWFSAVIASTFAIQANPHPFQKTPFGKKSTINSAEIEIQFSSPSSVGILKLPERLVLNKKLLLVICILLLGVVNLFAEDGHKLWLRGQSTDMVNISCSKNSATLDIAKQELIQSWQGKSGATVVMLVKSIPKYKVCLWNLLISAAGEWVYLILHFLVPCMVLSTIQNHHLPIKMVSEKIISMQ